MDVIFQLIDDHSRYTVASHVSWGETVRAATARAADLLDLTKDRAAVIVTHRPAELPGLPVVALA